MESFKKFTTYNETPSIASDSTTPPGSTEGEKAKHTNLPWTLLQDYDGRYDIFGPGHGELVLTLEDKEEAEDNGKLIVKACNNHEELVKALEVIMTNTREDSTYQIAKAALNKAK